MSRTTQLVEALGFRVIVVENLGYESLLLVDHGLALVDADLDSDGLDSLLDAALETVAPAG